MQEDTSQTGDPPVETPAVPVPESQPEVTVEPVAEIPIEPPAQPSATAPVKTPSDSAPAQNAPHNDSGKRMREKIQIKKRAKLDKILEFASGKEFIQNDDVQKLLLVSDATATRYLSQLVKEGKLITTGNPKRPNYGSKK